MRIATGIIAGLMILLFSTFLVPVSAMTVGNANVGSKLVISGIPIGADVFMTMNNGLPIFARAEPDGTVRYLPLVEGTLKIDVKQDGNLIDNKTLNVGPKVVSGSTSGGSGGGGGGTYPTVTKTPKKNQTNETDTTLVVDLVPTPTVTVSQQKPEVTVTKVKKETPKPTESPGFGAIAAIGLISILYMLRKNKVGKR